MALVDPLDVAVIVTALSAQALKEIGVPSPGLTQGALLYAGSLVVGGRADVGMAIVLAIGAGSLAGASVAYGAGRIAGGRLTRRPGRLLGSTVEAVERLTGRKPAGALLAVAIGRSVPALMAPLSVTAGAVRVPFAVFSGGVALATAVWAGLFAAAGALLGTAVTDLRLPVSPLVLAASAGVAIGVATLIWAWWRGRAGRRCG